MLAMFVVGILSALAGGWIFGFMEGRAHRKAINRARLQDVAAVKDRLDDDEIDQYRTYW